MWMETKNVQTDWNVIIVDGYIAGDFYSKPGSQGYDGEPRPRSNPLSGLATALGKARRDFFKAHSKEMKEYWLFFGPESECDHFAFHMPKRRIQNKDSSFVIENEPGLVYLMQLDRKFPFHKECLLDIMSYIGFRPKPESRYNDLSEFDTELERLSRQILKDYPSIEPVTERLLTHHGFKVVRPLPSRKY